ncbi:GNAT family N-acetyltransferase [Bacillus sp. Marseille-Q3570]|uniref:GNAT family N-acetyltransferase n=1 Tax=Bacillus sp. Marseille-Q3570 TaxID=2963522 RepID=UPI0021B7316F|nr:GNAT family N-acetyltransferase [Bacillus sp. Marseille-Q3570]
MKQPKIIETKRLKLVPISIEHRDQLFTVYSDKETTHYVPRETHLTLSETETLINRLLDQMVENKAIVYSIINKDNQYIIGTSGLYILNLEHRRASVGAVIRSNYWSKGYVTEALEKLIDIGFNEFDLIRIEGMCMHTNKASEKVMKKLGMTYEGTLRSDVFVKGNSYDSKVYSILKNEFAKKNV